MPGNRPEKQALPAQSSSGSGSYVVRVKQLLWCMGMAVPALCILVALPLVLGSGTVLMGGGWHIHNSGYLVISHEVLIDRTKTGYPALPKSDRKSTR